MRKNFLRIVSFRLYHSIYGNLTTIHLRDRAFILFRITLTFNHLIKFCLYFFHESFLQDFLISWEREKSWLSVFVFVLISWMLLQSLIMLIRPQNISDWKCWVYGFYGRLIFLNSEIPTVSSYSQNNKQLYYCRLR